MGYFRALPVQARSKIRTVTYDSSCWDSSHGTTLIFVLCRYGLKFYMPCRAWIIPKNCTVTRLRTARSKSQLYAGLSRVQAIFREGERKRALETQGLNALFFLRKNRIKCGSASASALRVLLLQTGTACEVMVVGETSCSYLRPLRWHSCALKLQRENKKYSRRKIIFRYCSEYVATADVDWTDFHTAREVRVRYTKSN